MNGGTVTAMDDSDIPPQVGITSRLIDRSIPKRCCSPTRPAHISTMPAATNGRARPVRAGRLPCESLKVTTRLMHVIAWLLTQRAVDAGEMRRDGRRPERRLGEAPETNDPMFPALPEAARR